MSGSYSLSLVVVSFLIAVLASYTALNLAARRVHAPHGEARWWLLGGSLALGMGVWSMHLLGIQAYSLPIALGYDLGLTAMSLAAALAAAAYALWLSAQPQLRWPALLGGGLIMASGIGASHYLGMAALRMQPGISYDHGSLGIALLLAMLAATTALCCAHHRSHTGSQPRGWRIVAALVMGIAITGMHYTGIAAAHFAPDSIGAAAMTGLDATALAVLAMVTTIAVLAVALLAMIFDRRMQQRSQLLDTHLLQTRQRLQQATVHDALTGLPNRTLLADRITQAIAKAAPTHTPLAVLFLNLDDFRSVNEIHGHAAGDQVLVVLAQRMLSELGPHDTLARLGADEFVVLSQVSGPDDAVLLAERLFDACTPTVQLERGQVSLRASIGIAMYPDDGNDQRSLICHANTAMSHCKQQLHAGHAFFTSHMQELADRQLRLLQDLRLALERNQLLLHYQPKLMAAGQPVIGAEALLRWQHPELGLLMPDSFIAIAERSGLIIPIGHWVLDQACAQLGRWHAAGYRQWSMAVNLSAVQFTAPDLAQSVAEVLANNGIAADRLTLEVTESTAMRDVEASLKILGELTAMGVHIAIDDFGTGYSSLLYLKRLPASELKIDRAFVKDLDAGGEDAAIVSSIIALGRTLQMRIVAEGVETAAQQAQLDAMGCDQLQGYHFNKPLDAATFSRIYCLPGADTPASTHEAAIRYCAAQ